MSRYIYTGISDCGKRLASYEFRNKYDDENTSMTNALKEYFKKELNNYPVDCGCINEQD